MIEIIGAIGGIISPIIIAWFTYNQYTKNKETDARIEKEKKETEIKLEKIRNEDKVSNKKRADNSTLVFGELWSVLYELKADRVYIVQPHPLGDEELLTVSFEVKRRWAEPMKPHIQNLKISEVANFASLLVKKIFIYISDIDKQVDDRYAKAIFASCGCKQAIVKRLSDNKHDWVGSIFVEFTDEMNNTEEYAHEILHTAATNIQYILPEILY